MKVQRLRVTFGRGEELKYITHLDLMRFWERALRRAQLPVAYSEGFSPHAQLSLAAPLPVGTTSEAELMDVFMDERIAPKTFLLDATKQLPPAMAIVAVEEAGLALPALQADVRFAEYLVEVQAAVVDVAEAGAWKLEAGVEVQAGTVAGAGEAGGWKLEAGSAHPTSNIQHPTSIVRTPEAAIDAFMSAATVPWQHKRDDEVRSYDIRAQVERIALIDAGGERMSLRMRLKNDNTGSGRPEQVALALGFGTPLRIHRTKLILAGTSPSRDAWRKRGRFAS